MRKNRDDCDSETRESIYDDLSITIVPRSPEAGARRRCSDVLRKTNPIINVIIIIVIIITVVIAVIISVDADRDRRRPINVLYIIRRMAWTGPEPSAGPPDSGGTRRTTTRLFVRPVRKRLNNTRQNSVGPLAAFAGPVYPVGPVVASGEFVRDPIHEAFAEGSFTTTELCRPRECRASARLYRSVKVVSRARE